MTLPTIRTQERKCCLLGGCLSRYQVKWLSLDSCSPSTSKYLYMQLGLSVHDVHSFGYKLWLTLVSSSLNGALDDCLIIVCTSRIIVIASLNTIVGTLLQCCSGRPLIKHTWLPSISQTEVETSLYPQSKLRLSCTRYFDFSFFYFIVSWSSAAWRQLQLLLPQLLYWTKSFKRYFKCRF